MINVILTGSETTPSATIRQLISSCPSTCPQCARSILPKKAPPDLAVSLTLEPAIVANLLADLPKPTGGGLYSSSFSVAPVTDELLDAWVRMLHLMDRPGDVPALAPAYEREILYRVLQGPLGWMMRDIATPGTALSRIVVTIRWIRKNFTTPFGSRRWHQWRH